MKKPFFSICIAAYKAERSINDCLSSIASQTFCDYEVIVVDDGSPEPLRVSADLALTLPSCRVVRTANCGPYAARQRAYQEAVGEVILTVDADDELFGPQALEKIFEEFAYGPDVVLFNASGSKVSSSPVLDLSSFGFSGDASLSAVWNAFTASSSLNSLWCKAFKKSLYISSVKKERPRLLMAEDRLQSLEIMAKAYSFRLINETLYYYRFNPTSTTNAGYDPVYFWQQCYVEAEVLDFMKKRDMPLKGWAAYFLGHISNVLLGIRYNSSLAKNDRIAVYESVVEEPVVCIAFSYLDQVHLPRVARGRLGLLSTKRFALLDTCMLPWKVGSVVKHLIRKEAC